MTRTMPELVREAAARDPDRLALVLDGGGQDRELTLGQWYAHAAATARGLLDRGVRAGDRVGVLVDEAGWLDYAVGSLAVYLAGGTLVGLPRSLSDQELVSRLEHCGVSGVLHSAPVVPPCYTGWAATLAEVSGGGRELPEVAVDPDGLAEIIYTSGTTGPAKPVAVPHANLTYRHNGGRGRLFEGVNGVLAPVPAATNAGHSAVMLALTSPTTVHLLSRHDPQTVARMLERLRAGMAIVPAPIAVRIVGAGLHRRHDLSGVAAFLLGSAPVPLAAVRRLSEAAPGARILIGYGSTESAPAFTHLPVSAWNEHRDPDYFQRPELSTVGAPGGGGTEAMIAGADGRPLQPGERGEIFLRSPAPPRSYYRDAGATARTFRDGWTRMGDLGHLDRSGYLHVFDRASDAITRHGRVVSSLRIEGALHWHPDVIQAAVFGIPDPDAGELVAAAVELEPLASAEELPGFLAERLEPEEVPTRIVAVDDPLPQGALGKVLKRRLRERLAS